MEPPPPKKIKSTHSSEPSVVIPHHQQSLFVDSTFPQDEALHKEGIKWKRPREICQCPHFIVDGATRMDVCQGNLSNCWFLSAVACLSLYPQLLEQVMPTGQDFGDGYNGKFRFQFWQYGRWVEVVVDDLLPTVQAEENGRTCYNLLFVHSKDKNEFWSSLLEKAYAKLKGGYSALQMGFAGEALEDMTGGVVQSSDVVGTASELWSHLNNMLQRGALICCGNTQGEVETSNLMGILSHHMYSVTGTKEVQTLQGPISLLRLRNPWGHTEWIGPWRDGGLEWQTVINPEPSENVILEDGEFWISVDDFRENFQFLEICHLGPQSLQQIGGADKPWDYVTYEGRWMKGLSAGGSLPSGDYYWMNPQFSLTLTSNDNTSDPHSSCSFIVSVMQKHQRLRRAQHMRVACHIFKGDNTHAYLFHYMLRDSQALISAGPCGNHREVVICSSLPSGQYIIIPSLEKEHDEGEFLVRILVEKGNSSRALENGLNFKDILTPSMCPTEAQCQSKFLQFANQECQIKDVQLQQLLASLLSELVPFLPAFPPETCRSLVATQDRYRLWDSWTGEQFYRLWKKILAGTQLFCNAQKGKDDKISIDQLVPALKAAGLPVDDFLVWLAQLRYGDSDGFLSYHHFICCLLKFQSLTEKFQAADPTGLGTVALNYRQWLMLAVYS